MTIAASAQRSSRPLSFLLLSLSLLVSLGACVTTTGPGRDVRPPPGRVLKPAEGGGYYTIRKGDTLYSVARRHGVEWRDILEANPSLNPRKMRTGTVLVIPGLEDDSEPPPAFEEPEVAPFNPGYTDPIPAEASMIWPIRGKVLARFGQRAPRRMWVRNNGIDVQAGASGRVLAAKSGRVNTFMKLPGFGKVVVLEHTDGTATFYGHVGQVLVRHGRWVKQGEVIATMGNSGGPSSGAQLHFRVLRNEKWVNPLLYLR